MSNHVFSAITLGVREQGRIDIADTTRVLCAEVELTQDGCLRVQRSDRVLQLARAWFVEFHKVLHELDTEGVSDASFNERPLDETLCVLDK